MASDKNSKEGVPKEEINPEANASPTDLPSSNQTVKDLQEDQQDKNSASDLDASPEESKKSNNLEDESSDKDQDLSFRDSSEKSKLIQN